MRTRIEADGPVATGIALALVAILAAASFSLSFLGLMQAAAWAGIPVQLRWLVPIVVDSTILVYAIAATVQRARGESTRISWAAVGFFTTVSVAANAAHVIAPDGVAQPLTASVIFGSFLAAIMPVSLFFATHTTVALVVAPVHGTVEQRQRRAARKLAQAEKRTTGMDQSGPRKGPAGGPDGPLNGPANGPGWTTRNGPLMDHQKDHPGPGRKPKAKAEPAKVRELDGQGLSQRAIAEQLGVSKTTVARILSESSRELETAGSR